MGKVFTALNKTTGDGRNTVRPLEGRSDNLEKEAEPERQGGGSPVVNSKMTMSSEVAVVQGMEEWDERLAAFSDLASPLAESFRRLRSKILHPPSGKPLKKIMLVSASPGAGKSFACANLGVSIAQGLEQHALLLDCDLRRPTLAQLFGLNNECGMVNYLQDGSGIGQLIKKTGMRKLSIISSGSKAVNPAELLGSEKVGLLFEELDSRYDDRFIIIDSPPLQAASETAVLARHVDAVIPVIRWGGSSRTLIKQQLATIDPEKILGVIFNAYQSNALSNKLSGYETYSSYY